MAVPASAQLSENQNRRSRVLAGFEADLTMNAPLQQQTQEPAAADPPTTGAGFSRHGLTRTLVLDLLFRYAGRTGLRAAGPSNVLRWVRNHTRKDPAPLVDSVFKAVGEES